MQRHLGEEAQQLPALQAEHAFADQLSQVLMSFYESGRKDVQTQAKAVFGFAP